MCIMESHPGLGISSMEVEMIHLHVLVVVPLLDLSRFHSGSLYEKWPIVAVWVGNKCCLACKSSFLAGRVVLRSCGMFDEVSARN